MDNLKRIIEVLVTNIDRSNAPFPLSLQSQLTSLSSNDFRPLALISHKRNHKNFQFTLKNCPQKHCIECLLGLSECEHHGSLTQYESALIKLIAHKLKDNSYQIQGERFCRACNSSDSPYSFAFKPCFCECVNCINRRLVNGNRACGICSSEYDFIEIREMYRRLGIVFPGARQVCSECGLPISSEVFTSSKCFVCYKIASFL